MASPVAQMVKTLPAMRETQVQSLGQEDVLPGESHGQRSLEGYSPWDHKDSNTTEQLSFTSHVLNLCYQTSAKSLQSYLTLCNPINCDLPGSREFSRQEYWSALPFPSPGIKRLRINKRWWGRGEVRTFEHCGWQCKLVQSLWKTTWRFFNN